MSGGRQTTMRRREFIAGLGGAAASLSIWPRAACAQQRPHPTIGYLGSVSLDENSHLYMVAFLQGLKESGYVEGQNCAVEYRWAEGRSDILPALVRDFVGRVAVIATYDTASALAAKAATTTVPIVFAIGGDPIKFGLVASLARPGENVTGVSFLVNALGSKRLGLLRELVPTAATFGFLVDPSNPNAAPETADMQAAADVLGHKLVVLGASTVHEIDVAFAAAIAQRVDALAVAAHAFLLAGSQQLAELGAPSSSAHDLRIPGVCQGRRPVELWRQPDGSVPSAGHPRGPRPQGRETRGVADPAGEPVRDDPKFQDREGARSRRAEHPSGDRRRGDRMMRRRDFIAGLGGTVAGSCTAWSQQSSQAPVVGFLSPGTAKSRAITLAAVRRGLADEGFVEGRNVLIEYRWGGDQIDRLEALAAELVRRDVRVIIALGGERGALAAKAVTTNTPVVFALAGHPVEVGLVQSLNRPGSNLTGATTLSNEIAAEGVELLRQLDPSVAIVALLVDQAYPGETTAQVEEAQKAARVLGLRLVVLSAHTDGEIEAAFDAMVQQHIKGLVVSGGTTFIIQSEQIVTLPARHAIPVAYPYRRSARSGGLMSYGPSTSTPGG